MQASASIPAQHQPLKAAQIASVSLGRLGMCFRGAALLFCSAALCLSGASGLLGLFLLGGGCHAG